MRAIDSHDATLKRGFTEHQWTQAWGNTSELSTPVDWLDLGPLRMAARVRFIQFD